MGTFFEKLEGKKTYILSGIAIALAAALQFDLIDRTTYDHIVTLLAPIGLITLRAAVNK